MMKKLALVMSAVLVLGSANVAAFAADGSDAAQNQAPAEYVGGVADSIQELQAAIDALPTVAEFQAMTDGEYVEGTTLTEAQYEAYMEAGDLYDTYDALTDAEKALVDVSKLEDLLAYFNGQTQEAIDSVPTEVTGVVLDDKGNVKSIDVKFTWENRSDITYRMVLLDASVGKGNMLYNTYQNKWKDSWDQSFEGIKTTKGASVIKATDAQEVKSYETTSGTMEFADGDIPTSADKDYYLYSWTQSGSGYYPDVLLTVIRVKDGEVYYAKNVDEEFAKVKRKHVHEWIYEADQSTNTISAYCTQSISSDDCEYYGKEKAVTLTVKADDKTYDGQSYAAEITNNITAVTGAEAEISYAKQVTLMGNQMWDSLKEAPKNAGIYQVSVKIGKETTTKEFKIKPVDVTITPDNASKCVGAADPTFTYQVTEGALVSGESLTGISIDRAEGETIGTYAINAHVTADANPNYSLNLKPGTLTIKDHVAKVDKEAVEPTCISTGLTAATSCSVCGKTLTTQETVPAKGHSWAYMTQDNTIIAYCDQTPADADCPYAKDKSELVLTLTAEDKTYDGKTYEPTIDNRITEITGEKPEISYSIEVDMGGGNFAYQKLDGAPKDAGTYGVTVAIGSQSVTRYFTISPAPVTVTVKDAGKHINAEDPALTYEVTEGTLAEGDSLKDITVSREAGEDAGTYDITAEVKADANPNYEITLVDGTFTIEDHTAVVDAAVAATCTKTGLTEGSHCSVCDAVLKAQEKVPALGHDWSGEWKVVKEATETSEGSRVKTCLRDGCGETQTEAIAKLPKKEVKPAQKTEANKKPAAVKTADENSMAIWMVLAVAAAACAGVSLKRKNRIG